MRIHYMQAFRFVFSSPRWFANLGWASLCMLSMAVIPVVGQLVLLGYLFDVVEALHRHGEDEPYPEFVIDEFGRYLVRGGWVFLVNLVVTLPVMFILAAVFLVLLFGTGVFGGGEPFVLLIVFVGVIAGAGLLLGVVLGIVLTPLTLRAGLGQDFAGAFSWEFLRDFLGRTWLQTLLVQLFLTLSGIVLGLAGLLLCCVGVYPALALQEFAQHYLYYQLYELYLSRGGMPIPLKREDVH